MCNPLEVGTGYPSTEDILDTAPSSTPSNTNLRTKYQYRCDDAISTEEDISPLGDDPCSNEVLPQTQVLELSAATPTVEVEQTEEELRRSMNGRSARLRRSTTYNSAWLEQLLLLSGRLPEKQRGSVTSVKQTNEELKSVGREGTQQKAHETASIQGVFGSTVRKEGRATSRSNVT